MGAPPNPFRPGAQYVPPDPNAKIYGARPLVRFLSQAVQPPSNVYVELVDVLRIVAASSQANEVLTVNYRLLLPNGDVTEGQTSVKISSDRAINIHDEPLAEGFLLSCSCKAAAATTRGQTFVRIFLVNPVLGPGQPSYMLMADYVTNAMAPAHPNGRVLAPTEGPGWRHSLTVANPGNNTDWSTTFPTNTRSRITSIAFYFNADATAGQRVSRIVFTSSTGVRTYEAFASAPVANTTFITAAGQGVTTITSATFYGLATTLLSLPDSVLSGGGIVRTISTFIGAGDNLNFIGLEVEEWLENV